jgi:SNF2 family DNA or RNA helicase
MSDMPPLWDHQKKAIEKSFLSDNLGILFDIGCGKTRTAIDIFRHKCAGHDRLLKTLILSPKITLTNWKREIAKFSKIHPRDVIILQGPAKKRLKQFMDATMVDNQLATPRVFISNYEIVEMEDVYKAITHWQPELIIADEAHRLKNPEGKRSKKVIALGDKSTYRYAATGTPVLNSAMDLFNIFRFLDKGATFGTNFWKFRNVWFEDENLAWSGRKGHFPKYVPRPETYAEFNKIIDTKAVKARKSECLDLPPFVREEVFVELSAEQRKLYEQMKQEYIAYIDDIEKTDTPRAVVAQMAVTKALRLQQIVTGYAKTEEGDIYTIKDNPRIEALSELLEELSPHHKIIVWSVFHENYSAISGVCKALKIPYGELHGRVVQKERERFINEFNNDPKCRVLIANQAAGGIGINLIASDISIFYSKNFSNEQDQQAEGRNYRGGSEIHQKVTRIDIVAENTIDSLIAEALAAKKNIASSILGWKTLL